MDDVTLTLVDVNPRMVDAWRKVFDAEPGVEVAQASLLDQRVDAWVSPTNARAQMSGGLDAAIRGRLGPGIQARVRRAVTTHWGDAMPVGVATCVGTGRALPAYLVSTPTMASAAENVSATMNVALACAAALQAVRMHNRVAPGAIASVAMPGLGAGTGCVPPDVCAELMWAAWHLFESRSFEGFDEMRAALADELGDLGPVTPAPARPGVRRAVLPVPYHGEGACRRMA